MNHLRGDRPDGTDVIGVYPLLPDEICTTAGNKKILPLEGCVASSLMLQITDSHGVPALEELSVFGES